MTHPQITIDRALCTACGLCVATCDPACLAMATDGPTMVYPERCIACGHCVAVCPTAAFHHQGLPGRPAAADPSAVPSPAALRQLLRLRRSIRRYQPTPLPRPLVEELLQVGCYAPTASNAQNVRFRAVDDPAAIERLSALTVRLFATLATLLGNGLVQAALPLVAGPALAQEARRGLADFRRLAEVRAAGGDPIFHRAPVVLVAHAQKGELFGRDNCLLAMGNVLHEAVARGLGTCLIGYFLVAWNTRPAVRRALGLPRGQRPYAVCTLGYPAVEYPRVPPRQPVPVVWQGEGEEQGDA
ncbi:MAG: 4Fe-4S binding protein [Chloroflexi bacterium]|nr:4Fe-4S binding protein [Chloroflexota bacterium]